MLNSFGTNKSGRRFSHNLTYVQSRSSEDKASTFSTNRRVASDVNIGIASPQVRGRTDNAEAEGICLGSAVKRSSSLAAPKAGTMLLRVRPLFVGAPCAPLALRLDIGYFRNSVTKSNTRVSCVDRLSIGNYHMKDQINPHSQIPPTAAPSTPTLSLHMNTFTSLNT